ncbi:unnamed protein product [Diabrotica balteata]|uniref:Uncharacterized protein n=1 Tax=Diabrotica balteata TaxID=107213 RepID=A0A9N9SVL8_DIABA|nr:unnamed protein product [Diabrotica balteata]
MEQLLLCNEVENEKNEPLFLTLVRKEAYKTIKDLTAPKVSSTRTYSQLKSSTKFAEKLKSLSKDCSFGEFLDEALHDKFVCGLKADNIRKRLLAEDNLTYPKVLQIAVAIEVAGQARLVGGDVNKVCNINFLSKKSSKFDKYPNQSNVKPDNREERWSCPKCASRHNPANCPSKN